MGPTGPMWATWTLLSGEGYIPLVHHGSWSEFSEVMAFCLMACCLNATKPWSESMLYYHHQCSKLSQKSCQSFCLESQIINIKLKKIFQKVPSPLPKLSASGRRTGSNLEHCHHPFIMEQIYVEFLLTWNRCFFNYCAWKWLKRHQNTIILKRHKGKWVNLQRWRWLPYSKIFKNSPLPCFCMRNSWFSTKYLLKAKQYHSKAVL